MFYSLDLSPPSPCVIPGSVLNMVCNIRSNKCNKTSAHLKFELFNLSSARIAVLKSHIRIINATAIELNYPHIQQDFDGATVKCLVRNRKTSCRDSSKDTLNVGSE